MMRALAALLVAAGGTFALRYGSVRSFSNRGFDARVALVLRHASLGIMAALAIVSLPTEGRFVLTDGAAATGVAVGVVAARRIRHPSVVIVLAVAGYAAMRAVGSG